VCEENVRIVRSAVEAFFSGEPARALPSVHPEIEFVTAFTEGKTYRGLSAIWEYKADLDAVWEDWHPEDSRFVYAGESRVLWLFCAVGRGKGSGVSARQLVASVWTLRDGLIWRGQGYRDHTEAINAVGLKA
jgi:ketosteroid isomerase-like protein